MENQLDQEEKKRTYFWEEAEHLFFIEKFQRYGRSWKYISCHLQGRDALQCRTHGQKYLKALESLKFEIETVLQGQKSVDGALCQRITKYEKERNHLLKTMIDPLKIQSLKLSQSGDLETITNDRNLLGLLKNIPPYLFKTFCLESGLLEMERNDMKQADFESKIAQISAAIANEVSKTK